MMEHTDTSARQAFVDAHVTRIEPLMRETNVADWDAAVSGTEEANARVGALTSELLSVYADQHAFKQVRRWNELPTGEPALDRQIRLLFLAYAGSQQDDTTIHRITGLETNIRSAYVNFRGTVAGHPLSDNDIGELLATANDSNVVRAAWEASKQIGWQVARDVIELVHVRNDAARGMGFNDHWRKDLQLAELDEGMLFDLFDDLASVTELPYAREMAALNEVLGARFGVATDQLRPWHYGDPFFQRPPRSDSRLDDIFSSRNLEDLAIQTFDGVGMNVRPILQRSDLYERSGKNQHAFCTSIDRKQDVRMLCNLKPTERWMETLLHELGHAVYDTHLDPALPFLLRTPSHILTTEAMAMLMGRLPLDGTWLRDVVGVPATEVQQIMPVLQARQRLGMLIFVRWVLVMVHFERALYTDPEQDLNSLWWDLVERFQQIRRPEGRNEPDWAAKIHLALYPVYYQNYLLGELTASQISHTIHQRCGGFVNSRQAGEYLKEAIFAPGTSVPWTALIEQATGTPLSARAFEADFVVGLF